MKLAEALLERKELNVRIESLKNRLLNNAQVQEGLQPAEDPAELLKALEAALDRLEYLITHINKTNTIAKVATGESIADMIAKKDVLTKKISILTAFNSSGSAVVQRARHSEIKILSTFDVKKLQQNIDKLSKELRLIDVKLQECNWTTELV